MGPYYNDMLPAPQQAATNMLPSLKERMVPGGSVMLGKPDRYAFNDALESVMHYALRRDMGPKAYSSSANNLNSAPPPREKERPPRKSRLG